jgi:hypothetical protein
MLCTNGRRNVMIAGLATASVSTGCQLLPAALLVVDTGQAVHKGIQSCMIQAVENHSPPRRTTAIRHTQEKLAINHPEEHGPLFAWLVRGSVLLSWQ